jgi:hypothetical protein
MKTDATESAAESTETLPETLPPATESDAPSPSRASAPHPSVAIVDEWFTKHFHNMSALFDERSYTHLLNAKEDLKVSLAQSL